MTAYNNDFPSSWILHSHFPSRVSFSPSFPSPNCLFLLLMSPTPNLLNDLIFLCPPSPIRSLSSISQSSLKKIEINTNWTTVNLPLLIKRPSSTLLASSLLFQQHNPKKLTALGFPPKGRPKYFNGHLPSQHSRISAKSTTLPTCVFNLAIEHFSLIIFSPEKTKKIN